MIAAHTQLAGEREFAGCGFGAAADTVCHAKKPVPNTVIRRLQTALRDLAKRVGDAVSDPNGGKAPDGLVGPKTVKAVNYAVPKYTTAPAVLSTGKLTHAQVVSFAPQLAAFIEKAPQQAAPMPMPSAATIAQMPAANLPAAPRPAYTPRPGGSPMPYPAPPAQYYPPGYAPAPSYPGYAPQREASVDIKTFIPAQYEHVRFNPMTVALVLAVGVGTVLVMNKRAEKK